MRPPPIEGVATGTAGFVGQTTRGPAEPRLVTSWTDFRRWFGGVDAPETSYMPYAVRGFFDNGGKRAYIARVTPAGARPSRVELPTSLGGNVIVESLGPGDLNSRLFAWVGPHRRRAQRRGRDRREAPRIRLVVLYYETAPETVIDPFDRRNANRRDIGVPDIVEDFDGLSIDTDDGNLELESTLVSVVFGEGEPPSPTADTGAVRGTREYVPAIGGNSGIGTAGNLAGAMTLAEFQGTPPTPDQPGTGLAGLEAIDDISLLTVPDEANSTIDPVIRNGITAAVVAQCEHSRDRFGILQLTDSVNSDDPTDVSPSVSSSYAALYFPWVRVSGRTPAETLLIPPSGHVAGALARSDIERGIHKAPANLAIRGIVTADLPEGGPLSVTISDSTQDVLNMHGVNVIRDFRGASRGIRIWGARTLADDPEWKYVSVRRLFMFLEQSIGQGTRWVAFEPNTETTWAAVEESVAAFLIGIWRDGGLLGAKQEQAFFVKCNRTTMSQIDIDRGRLVCEIGVAPTRPGEFVIFRIGQWTIDAQP